MAVVPRNVEMTDVESVENPKAGSSTRMRQHGAAAIYVRIK